MTAIERLKVRRAAGERSLKVLSASGQLGYGIPAESLRHGLDWAPDFIGCDMGSVDPGPAYLGAGQMATSPELTRRDLRLVLLGARQLDVPLLLGSAGTAGARPHLDQTLEMIREIAAEEGLSFRLASISSDVSAEAVIAAKRAGHLHPLGEGLAATEEEIAASSHIVGQMGTEAFIRALDAGADVVIAGRACDTAIFTAIPQMLNYDTGLAMQMAKIIECTSICCVPGGRDPMMAVLGEHDFELESTHSERRATPISVAAHALYEQSDPDIVYEPEGALLLDQAMYEPIDDRRLRVSGGVWRPAERLSVKIEGARRAGERMVLLAATADPGFITQLDMIVPAVEATVRSMVEGDFELNMRPYGVGALVAPTPAAAPPREAFLLVEVIAERQETAKAALSVFKQYLLHHGFPGRLCTGGNLAFPFTPPELDGGTAWQFSLYHRMTVETLEPYFPVEVQDL
uniref:acyclic terpene utilization AtuA family protein n=1 Tax=Roseovarius indicus TaxID=540747 RepID=UPI003B5294D5